MGAGQSTVTAAGLAIAGAATFGNFLSDAWSGISGTPLPILIGIAAVVIVGAFVASVAYDGLKALLKRPSIVMPAPERQEHRP